MDRILQADIQDPTAMSVAIVDSYGQPWSRMKVIKVFLIQMGMFSYKFRQFTKLQKFKQTTKYVCTFRGYRWIAK